MQIVKIRGVKTLEDDSMEVTTKDGVIVLDDVGYNKINAAKKRNKGNEEIGMISAMIVSLDGDTKRVGELTVEKFKGSTITKLIAVCEKLLGGDDFLLEEDLNQTQYTNGQE